MILEIYFYSLQSWETKFSFILGLPEFKDVVMYEIKTTT